MLTRFLLLSTLAFTSVSTAAAERRCTPGYNGVTMYDSTSKVVAGATTVSACRDACIADTNCAAFLLLAGVTCLTSNSVATETYSPSSTDISGRCMDVKDLRLLLLPQENADYPGLDVANALSPNPTDCSYKCQDTPGCNAYTWSTYNGGSCWMKSGKPDSVSGPNDGSVVSGEVYTCQRPQYDSDIAGEDLSNVQRPKWSDCCGVCRRTNGCVAFSWTGSSNGGTCWLKKKITGITHANPNTIAAVLN